jgi:hypothetical protein
MKKRIRRGKRKGRRRRQRRYRVNAPATGSVVLVLGRRRRDRRSQNRGESFGSMRKRRRDDGYDGSGGAERIRCLEQGVWVRAGPVSKRPPQVAQH